MKTSLCILIAVCVFTFKFKYTDINNDNKKPNALLNTDRVERNFFFNTRTGNLLAKRVTD